MYVYFNKWSSDRVLVRLGLGYVCMYVSINQTNRYIFYSLNTDGMNYAIKTLSLCMYVVTILLYLGHFTFCIKCFCALSSKVF